MVVGPGPVLVTCSPSNSQNRFVMAQYSTISCLAGGRDKCIMRSVMISRDVPESVYPAFNV